MVRNFHRRISECIQLIGFLATIVTGLLVGACAPSHFVVTGDPQLAGIHTVYVFPFESLSQSPEAAAVMTEALKAQLIYDGSFQVLDDPKLADAHFKGTVGKWTWGGLDLNGARSSEVSGSLMLINATHETLWFAAAVQRDPLRLIADGLFARPPRVLAPYWARTVLQQLPGYVVKGRPEATTRRGQGPSGPQP